ncbi:MAG TPA: phospholipase D-like domain-containing protein, partial [Kineosporiaceae bacterium]|nr:phospholipase D-like domain-containing protein [Kineosporiaceae bacterium]
GRADPDERLDGPETEISRVLCEAADRGVVVRGLLWRSHLDRLQFSERENRHPCGDLAVQLLRTYPYRGRVAPYPFAPQGERSIARGYRKAVRRARSLIYVEDQYLWSQEVVSTFADVLRHHPQLRLIAVLPRYPDQDGRTSMPPNLVGRVEAVHLLNAAGPGRVGLYSPENHHGLPVYVHAKVCVVDDVWACVGSGNLNRRSWTNDSELSCAVLDPSRDPRHPVDPAGLGDGARAFARALRIQLGREHLDLGSDEPLIDPGAAFDAFARHATDLEDWHNAGRAGPPPPGRLRPYVLPSLSAATLRWARPLYSSVYDPDGRPRRLRRSGAF